MTSSLFHLALIRADRSMERYTIELLQSKYISDAAEYVSGLISSLLQNITTATPEKECDSWTEITHADANIKGDIRKDINQINIGKPETYDQIYPIYARIMDLERSDHRELTEYLMRHISRNR